MKSFVIPQSFNILRNFFEPRKQYRLEIEVTNKFRKTMEKVFSVSTDLELVSA